MSGAMEEPGQLNGHAIADEDLAELLARERAQSQRLKAELAQEKGHRSRAESAASSAATQRIDAETQAVEARLSAADDAAKGLRKDYADALAEGRFDDAADANDKLAELRARQQEERQYRNWLAAEKERAAAPPPPAQDRGLDLSGYTTGQRKWIEDNPAFLNDEKVRLKTIAGHNIAVANGAAVDSAEYFDIINRTVHDSQPAAEADDGHEGTPYRPPERAGDMPVSRRAQAPQQTRAAAYRLSAAEREAADTMMPDVPVDGYVDQANRRVAGRYERYAINREKLRQQGRG